MVSLNMELEIYRIFIKKIDIKIWIDALNKKW